MGGISINEHTPGPPKWPPKWVPVNPGPVGAGGGVGGEKTLENITFQGLSLAGQMGARGWVFGQFREGPFGVCFGGSFGRSGGLPEGHFGMA